jgi:hypothetical protein
VFTTILHAQQGDYRLVINGETIELNEDRPVTFTNQKGERVSLLLRKKDTLTYVDDFVEFQYPKEFSISKTAVEEDVQQLTLITADGNGFLVQEYKTMNPSMLVDIMLEELTKESTSYGFSRRDADMKIDLPGGMKLEGKKTVLEYKDEKNSYAVLTYGAKDAGVLVAIIFTEDEETSKDRNLIDLFLRSIRLKKIL